MTCVYKEYEIKIKMVQEQRLQLKMKFLLNYKIILVGEIDLWWRKTAEGRRYFQLSDCKIEQSFGPWGSLPSSTH